MLPGAAGRHTDSRAGLTRVLRMAWCCSTPEARGGERFGLAGESCPHDQKGDEGHPVGAKGDEERVHWASSSNVGKRDMLDESAPAYGVIVQTHMGFSAHSNIRETQ